MVATFRERFSGVPIEQDTVEASEFFDRSFDCVLAWGLLFLLEPQTGAMGALPPSGRSIAMQGITVYCSRGGRIAGHRQVVDRLGVAQQLGLGGPRAPNEMV